MQRTSRSDWQTVPMPATRAVLPLDRQFEGSDMAAIRRGLIPEEMEDKWFIYWSRNRLYFHRSWTGICIYVVRFKCDDAGGTAVEALANRDPAQYLETDDERDKAMILFLIDVVLLHRPGEFPSTEPSGTKRAVMQWSQVGRAGIGKGPGTH